MQIIKELAQLTAVEDNKIICGKNVSLDNSTIKIDGKNNILVIKDGVKIKNSTISFCGSNSVVFLCENNHQYLINVSIYNNSVMYFGRNNYYNGTLNVALSEEKHCFIGDDNLFSFGIWIRLADPHLVYRVEDKKRINLSKSVFIGDHVWVGQSAMLLKGTQINSGSILGAMALSSGKRIQSNSSWGGNPAKEISTGVFWDSSCVHQWTEEQTKESMTYSDDRYIYSFDSAKYISFDDMDAKLSSCKSADERLDYLFKIYDNREKNRFARFDLPKKKKLFR